MQPHTHPKRTVKSVELDSSFQLENDDELSIELRSYKARVKCVSRAFTSTAPGIHLVLSAVVSGDQQCIVLTPIYPYTVLLVHLLHVLWPGLPCPTPVAGALWRNGWLTTVGSLASALERPPPSPPAELPLPSPDPPRDCSLHEHSPAHRATRGTRHTPYPAPVLPPS